MHTKTFRPLFVAAAVAFMLMATVEAAPATDALRCQICDGPPECESHTCPGGHYCEVNYCTCRIRCIKGHDPRK
ncbi:hypothetical protein BGZ82_007530 [Podila clonocystis]|nr:hypothetical protein BGZ82_007530 [Podila clonocystis]